MATEDEVHQLQRKFDVSPTLAQLLYLLATNVRLTAEQIEETGVVADARVSIHRLRKIMAAHEIDIRAAYKTGYWLSEEDQAIIKACLKVAA